MLPEYKIKQYRGYNHAYTKQCTFSLHNNNNYLKCELASRCRFLLSLPWYGFFEDEYALIQSSIFSFLASQNAFSLI